jgi:hypothetical protein
MRWSGSQGDNASLHLPEQLSYTTTQANNVEAAHT